MHLGGEGGYLKRTLSSGRVSEGKKVSLSILKTEEELKIQC